MKTAKSFLMPLALICFFITSTIFSNQILAQETNPPVYYSVGYMKVQPENVADYKKLEKVWKKMHEMRIKKGALTNWFISEVVSPYGTSTEYNFIVGNVYVGREMLANSYKQGAMMEFFKSLSSEEQKLVNRTTELRDMVKMEVFQVRGTVDNGSDKPAKISVVNFMKFNKGYRGRDMGAIENTYWKPLHQHRVKKGQMYGWGMYSKEMPYGAASEYSATTVDFYDTMKQMLAPWNIEAQFKKIHPDKKIEDMMKETEKVRTLVKAEVWMLLDYTDVPASEIVVKKK